MRTLAAVAVLVLAAACGGSTARPDLQQVLDSTLSAHLAPGVTAFVSGPRGTWAGASGHANVATRAALKSDDMLRLESVTKLWTAVVVVKLAQEKKLSLDDTLGTWWPSLFKGEKARITIRQLLNHSSGLIDNNDIGRDPAGWIAKIRDPRLRGQLTALVAQLDSSPSARFDDLLEIRAAAALPLLAPPGRNWHYSNIGYMTAGHIAEKASGESLDALYRRIIIEPLHLHHTVYAPRGPVPRSTIVGYARLGGRWLAASTAGTGALGPEGGMVTDARDEAAFLRAALTGKLVPTNALLHASYADGTYALGISMQATPCGLAYHHGGAGAAWRSYVAASRDGKRVVVLLWNGHNPARDDPDLYAAAALSLFCRA